MTDVKPFWRQRPVACGCDQPIYVQESNAIAAAGGDNRPADVVAVYRCPASKAWHVAPEDGLPANVLESTGRRLAYELLTHKTLNFNEFRVHVLGISMEANFSRWRKARRRYANPMVAAGVATECSGVLTLADPAAANRIVQVGLDEYLLETGRPGTDGLQGNYPRLDGLGTTEGEAE